MWERFYLRLIERSYFPRVADADAEFVKIGWLRIACGLVVLTRTLLSTVAAWHYFPTTATAGASFSPQFAWSLLECVLALFLTIGLFTPATIVGLIISYAACDSFLGILNLGTMVLIHVLFLLFITNSGLSLSLDARLSSRDNGRLARVIGSLQAAVGKPSARQLTAYYFIAFATFALINFGALTVHLDGASWLNGQTVASLLVGSLFSKHFDFFRLLEARYPEGFMLFSRLSVFLESFFQAFMIPLMFTRIGAVFVAVWGALFCLTSLLLLNLSFLPFAETLLWSAIFLPAGLFVHWRPAGKAAAPTSRQPPRLTRLYAGAYLAVMAVFTCNVALLIFERLQITRPGPVAALARPMMHLGWWCPDVFNEMDLSSSDAWRVVYRRFPDGRESLVPLTKPSGERDRYCLFDEIVFGNELPWRRIFQRSTFGPASFHRDDRMGASLNQKLVDFDYRFVRGVKPSRYRVVIMGSSSSDYSKQPPDPARHNRRILYQYYVAPGAAARR